MWRIKCSHSATDKQPAFSLVRGGTGGAEELEEARAAGRFSGSLLLAMFPFCLHLYPLHCLLQKEMAKKEEKEIQMGKSGQLLH